MDNKKLDIEAPLLSVRRFSEPPVTTATDSSTPGPESDQRPMPGRRASLPFYKAELNSGPVRIPGVVPFVWENKPGEPKNDLFSDSNVSNRRQPVVPKPPPGSMTKDKERAVLKPGSSVRTRKSVTFSVDNGNEKAPPTNEGSSDQSVKFPTRNGEEKDNVMERKDVKATESKVELNKGKEKECQDMEETKGNKQPELPISEDETELHAFDEEDAFSDALDTLSRSESVFMNCSVSGVSGITDLGKGAGSFSTDPLVRDFMIGRFLPAAQAMASDSPLCTFRKAVNPAKENARTLRSEAQLPLKLRPNFVLQHPKEQEIVDDDDSDEEDEEDYDNPSQHLIKGCGFLPSLCLKGSFGRLNLVPGMDFHGRKPTPPRRRPSSKIKTSLQASLGRPGDSYSWEDVYKHKMGHGNKQGVRNGSKMRNESNVLTLSSESPTVEGSSPHHQSAVAEVPAFRNEDPVPALRKEHLGIPRMRESKSSNTDGSDFCEKDVENFWETTSNHSSHLDSASPALEKTVYVDSVNTRETLTSKSSSLNTIVDSREIINLEKDSDAGNQSRRMEEGFVIEMDSSQLKLPQAAMPGLLSRLDRLNHEDIGRVSNPKQNNSENSPLLDSEKNNTNPLQSLLPPPLPKTPSESWLSRTLPSVTSKNSASQALLTIRCPPKVKTLQAPIVDKKLEPDTKLSKSQVRRIRFAEVLAIPASPRSES